MTNRTDLPPATTPFLWISLLGKKKKSKQIKILEPSCFSWVRPSFGHLQTWEPPPCPRSEWHKSHSSSCTHSLGIPYCILTTGKPPLLHICTTSSVSGVHPCLATGLFLMTRRIRQKGFLPNLLTPPHTHAHTPHSSLLALKCFGSRAQLRNQNKGSTQGLCVQGGRSVGSPVVESVAPSNCTSGPRAP